ncbi:hypothetical protein TNCV_4066531 [Trichonephila clavipes]|uniref:Uncharacterized protein n=1 Tax=Trichonephila clavipes TaxID=2585209 RepID=A0A8X6W8T9_TRICX|nr:hypothetical protein TNCV_4066531 [Trichonephila clavipes]
MWQGVHEILIVCLWKRIPYCLYEQQKFVFEAAGCGSRYNFLPVDQRAANCLEEAVRSSSCADVTFRLRLPVLRVVRCSSVHCFQTHMTVKLFSHTRGPIVCWENLPPQTPIISPH